MHTIRSMNWYRNLVECWWLLSGSVEVTFLEEALPFPITHTTVGDWVEDSQVMFLELTYPTWKTCLLLKSWQRFIQTNCIKHLQMRATDIFIVGTMGELMLTMQKRVTFTKSHCTIWLGKTEYWGLLYSNLVFNLPKPEGLKQALQTIGEQIVLVLSLLTTTLSFVQETDSTWINVSFT